MIELCKLNKIYNQHKTNVCHALKDVSFSLPNKGLVFILGKSGSGKSTLLNLLGAMDDITSGDIIVEGESLKNASLKQLDYYRTNYISIIYQNFCLFENETVLQNVSLSTFISKQKSTHEDIERVLDVVDLTNKKNVLVKELSGGQKQRVAIARALLKHPKLLLADEPTGNLDSRTTKSIFNSLVKISKNILVVVITHDIASAEKYGDRIIEIGDGKILGDKVINPDHVEEEKPNTIYLDENYQISKNKLNTINELLEVDNLHIEKKDPKFLPLKEQPQAEKQESAFCGKEKSRKVRPAFSIGKTFFKNNIKSFVASLIIITFIFSVSVSAQLFSSYSQESAIVQTAHERQLPNFYLEKIHLTEYTNDELNVSTIQDRVNDTDIQNIRSKGYNGKIYPVYNVPVIAFPTGTVSYSLEGRMVPRYLNNYDYIYPSTGVGTCVCDLSYLNKIFGYNDQKLTLLAGTLQDLDKSTSLIVTDFFADSVLEGAIYYGGNPSYISDDPNDPYRNLFNKLICERYHIGAVIKTDYKERFKTTFKLLDKIHTTTSSEEAKETLNTILNSDEYAALVDYAQTTLNVTYSINPNFAEDYVKSVWWGKDIQTRYSDEYGNTLYKIPLRGGYYISNSGLKDGEILLHIGLYNAMFKTSLVRVDDPDFKEKNVIIDYFDSYSNGKDNPNVTLKVKVVGLIEDDYTAHLSTNDLQKTKVNDFTKTALVLDDVDGGSHIAPSLSSSGFTIQSITFTTIRNLSTIVNVFSEIFAYVFIVLLVIIVFVELTYYLKVINRNRYRMGVYRSLGVSSETLTISTLGNALVFNVLLFATSLGFSIGSAYLVNSLITKSFVSFLKMGFVNHISLVSFSFTTFLLLFAIMVAVSILAIVFPIIRVRKIKPNVMMNSAEDK